MTVPTTARVWEMTAESIFVDREGERKVLADLVDSAHRGTSGALVVHGDAGMGKTALLDLAVSLTSSAVARISGVEAEQPFAFAALHRLFVPFMHRIAQLPPPQRMALQTAFGLQHKGPPDKFLIGLAALGVFAAEASASGLVCVIDDVQWIDEESLETLAFVGRRIRAEGLILLFGLRTHLELPPTFAGLPTMEVKGLPHDAAVELLTHAQEGPMPSHAIERLIRETDGCPLALWELAHEFAETRTTGEGVSVERLTLTRRLEDHFFQQVAGLSPDTQLLLLIAAAEASGDPALVGKVAREFGIGIGAHADATDQTLLMPGPEIRFRHPLIRSAVYARADPELRRAVHRALAEAMGKNTFPERWAGHVAQGAAGPSEQLAGELESMSQMAKARGGYRAQASLLAQAANLSESLQTRSVRLLDAAAAALTAGAYAYSADLLDQAEPYLSEPVAIAEALHLRGQLAIGQDQPNGTPALLLAAARSMLPLNMNRARAVLLEAFDACILMGGFGSDVSARDVALVAEQTNANVEPLTMQDHLLDAATAFFSGDYSVAYAHYRSVGGMLRSEEFTDDQIVHWGSMGLATSDMFDDSTYNLWMARTDASARKSGALLTLLLSLLGQITAEVRSGNLRAAAVRHAEVLDVAAAIGLPAERFIHMDHFVRAWAGDEAGTRASAGAVIDVHESIGGGAAAVEAHFALAVLHIGAGRFKEALAETDFIRGLTTMGFPAGALPLAVEAAVKLGQFEKAHDALVDLEERTKASGTPWALGLLAQSTALLTGSPDAEKYFQEAIDLLHQTSVATEVFRSQLLYGEWLRRERRQIEARTQLRHVHAQFSEIGAMGFAERARVELLATGERARKRSVETSNDLTPQEEQISRLVGQGASNREIAAKLFISTSTVEYHLHKTFRKLGVKSRTQLARYMLESDS
jgi:DNA-binding CsgD family transcriptional regulator